MAVFGRDFYGLAKYGTDVQIEFDVSPFVALSDGYNAIRTSWNSPTGAWTRLRLLKSRYGYAANENDGELLLETTPPGANDLLDDGLAGGVWYYYTLFIEQGGQWYRAGSTSGLSLRDTGVSDLVWEKIPRYFRYARRQGAANTDDYFFDPSGQATVLDPDRFDVENQHLRKFMEIVGWGFDYVRNFQETLLQANDARTTHLENLDRMARQLGIDYSYAVPARVSREKVANAGLLARRRGTLDGLRDVATLTTGWDVDIEVGPNLLLNEDQAQFANPTYPEWNSGVNYAVGQRVQFGGRIMECQIGAYQDANKPPTEFEGNSNTWWKLVADNAVELTRSQETGAISTWKGWAGNTENPVALAVGVSSHVDTQVKNSNALKITNTGSTPKTLDIWGASNPLGSTSAKPSRGYVVRQGIPIPRVLAWDSEEEYVTGELVLDDGVTWRALGVNTGLRPKWTPEYWEQVGIDERPKMALSFYGHGALSGTAGTGGAPVNLGPAFFDDRGNLIADFNNYSWAGVFFDTFNESGVWAQRTPDLTYANEKWTTLVGAWSTDDVEKVAYPSSFATSGAVTTVPAPEGESSYWVSVTFGRPARGGKTDALAIRYVDANNYLRVTRNKVEGRYAGVLSTLDVHDTPISEGDRVSVLVNDTAGTWAVYRTPRGEDVATHISSGTGLPAGSAPYRHGLMVE